mgnify:CR=1 FL=1
MLIPLSSWGQCQDENACNFNENEPCEFFSCFECDYLLTVPETYEFFRNGESTVYYNGQTCRLQMAVDIYSALNEDSYTAEQVLEMFNEGTGFPNEYDCGKNIGNRTAQTSEFPEYIKLQFDQMIEEYFSEVVPNFNNPASIGVSGVIIEACSGGGEGYYRVNGKGLEIDQVFIKGLMGAMVIDQINNKYLNRVLNNESSNDTNDLNSLGYTDMEHDLDEAFGNLYGYNDSHVGGFLNNANGPAEGHGQLVNKYLEKINDDDNSYGIAGAIYHAFVIARHSIVTNNYVERDFQINVIKSLLNKVIINRALYYLIRSAETLESCPVVDTFHDLSQAYGFIFALQFTDYFDTNQVENILNQMIDGNGLWDITSAEINDIIEFLTTNSGFNYYENVQYQYSVSESITEYCDCSDDNETLSALGGCEAAISIFEDLGGCNYVFNGTLISDICQESCGECNSTNLDEDFIKKKLLYTTDLIGKIYNKNRYQLNFFDDGSVEKKYVVN